MTDQSTELIWHFIGYLHIEELLQKSALHFNGAYISTGEEVFSYDGSSAIKFNGGPVSFSMPGAIAVNPAISADLQSILYRPTSEISQPYSSEQLRDLAIEHAPGSPFRAHDGSYPPVYTIHLNYSHADQQAEIFTFNQSNSLINNDQLISTATEGVSDAFGYDAGELLLELVDNAQESLDELSLNPFDSSPGDIAQMLQDAGEDLVAGEQDGVLPHPDEVQGPLSGKYVNGVELPAEAATQNVTPVADEETENPLVPAPDEETTDSGTGTLHITTYYGQPTGGAAQIAELGANESTNTAVMADYSDSYGSIIVGGDVFATNAIIQANILHDNDAIGFSGTALVSEASGGENKTENSAEFIFDNVSVAGNAALGVIPVGASWNVDYIDGDVYDMSILVQENLLIDNDLSQQTASNTHFTAATGANSQSNEMLLFEYGETYDLVIVGGNYYEFNVIVQYNVLLDDDILELSSDGSLDTTMSANAGGNVLTNEASIVNIGGGDRFSGSSDEARDLANQVGDEAQTVLSPLTWGMPGNGSDTMNVLYISGDLFDMHAIYQINVMMDLDLGSQQLAADEASLEQGEFSQEISSGGNILTNTATIVDVDSTSNYQFVGGQYYEDSLLIQTEMVTSEDEISFDDQTELIATTVAILTGSSEDAGTSNEEIDQGITGPGGDEDVLGGVLS